MFIAHGPVQFDVFVHLWNFNSRPKLAARPDDVEVSQSELDDLRDLLKPHAMLVEGKEVSPRAMLDSVIAKKVTRPDPRITAIWTCDQFYSMMRCAHLKRQQELAQGWEYDVCVKVRSDTVIPEHHDVLMRELALPIPNTVHAVHSGWDERWQHPRVGDIMFFADSPTFDRYCDFFRFMHCIDDRLFCLDGGVPPPEIALFYFTKMLNLKVFPLPVDVKVRRGAEYLELLQSLGMELGSYEVE